MGTNNQTVEPRVEVIAHIAPPCDELPNGFYAAFIGFNGTKTTDIEDAAGQRRGILIDMAKIPNLIHDLQNALIDMSAQAELAKLDPSAPLVGDWDLLEQLELEEGRLVDIQRPEFSGATTAAIAATGNYWPIWVCLNETTSETWDRLSDTELLAIIKDYKHTVEEKGAQMLIDTVLSSDAPPRPPLLMAAKAIFVGRSDIIEAASPEVNAKNVERQPEPAAGGRA